MSGVIRWFLGNRVAPNLLMVALLLAGALAMVSITVRQFPEIATGTVQVIVALPGGTPQEIARSIVEPIENGVEGLEGVRRVRSTASLGLATVTVDTERGADVAEVLDDVETEVERITVFPERAEDPRTIELEPDELAAQVAISGDADADALKTLAERARSGLLDLPGVSRVEVSGAAADRIDVELRRDALEALGLGLTEVAALIGDESLDLSGGRIETDEERILLRAVGEETRAGGYREKPLLVGADGQTVRLGDVATVREVREDGARVARLGDARAVLVSVYRVGDEQVLDLVDAVKAHVDDELAPSMPPGVEAALWRDEAESLRGRIRLLTENALLGVALIVGILLLFLDLRVAAWVAFGVVVAFVGTFAAMQPLGVTINQLSLFGFILALGMIVDDAIVVGESTYAEQRRTEDPREATERAVMRVWKPTVFSSLTTIAAFLPLVFLPGSSGAFIGDIAIVVILVLVVSLVESLLILPHHLSRIVPREPRKWSPRRFTEPLREKVGGAFERFSDGRLRRAVGFAADRPGLVVSVALAVSIASFGLLSAGVVRFVFFPEIEGNYAIAELELADGATAEATARRAEGVARAAREAARAVASGGEGDGGDGGSGDAAGGGDGSILRETLVTVGFSASGQGAAAANVATVEARLVDAEGREASTEAFANAWREAAGEVPGAKKLTFSASAIGVGDPIVLQVASANEASAHAAVGRIVESLAERDGVFDLRDDRFSTAREIRVRARPEAAAYGLDQATIARAVRAAFYGARVTEIQRDREEVEVRVRLAPGDRDSIEDLERYRVPVPGAAGSAAGPAAVPLRTVAELEFAPAPSEVVRVDGRTVTTVTADVDTALTSGGAETGRILSELVPELTRDYPDLVVTVGGEQEEQRRFGPALLTNFVLALFAIYAILALAFGSYGRPLIVLAIIPFGFVGALLGHAALGLNLTLLSMFGVIGLAGVIVNDALLVVDYVISNERDGQSPREAIVAATVERFRPITLTTMTTFFGIAPLILETSVQAQFLVPTAVALGIGILFGSGVMILLVPALASVYARAASWLDGGRATLDGKTDGDGRGEGRDGGGDDGRAADAGRSAPAPEPA